MNSVTIKTLPFCEISICNPLYVNYMDLTCFNTNKRFIYLVMIIFFSHVKGRVLVALADGTVAVFHRLQGRRSVDTFPSSSVAI